MSRRDNLEAVRQFRHSVNEQLAAFTRTPAFVTRKWEDEPYLLALASPARLARDLYLMVEHYFAVAGAYVETVGYRYTFENAEGREIVSYHWHPTSPVVDPHLHLGPAAQVGRPNLARAHIPTGSVGWAEILWLVRELTTATPR